MKRTKFATLKLSAFYFVVLIAFGAFGASVREIVRCNNRNAEFQKELQREIEEDHSQIPHKDSVVSVYSMEWNKPF